MNEKGYFQIRQRFRLQVKMHVWLAAGLCPDPLRELKRSPDFIFKSQMQQKRLAAGLRPDRSNSY